MAQQNRIKNAFKSFFKIFNSADRARKKAERKLQTCMDRGASSKILKHSVQNLLDNGGNLNEGGIGGSLLTSALLCGDINLAKYLIEKGVNVNGLDKKGRSTLSSLSLCGKHKMAKWLLAHGANINVLNADGRRPLHAAVASGYLEMVQILLKQGAYVDASDNNGESPLYNAIYLGREEIVKFLLENHANPNTCDTFEQTPLDVAIFWTSVCVRFHQHKSARVRTNIIRSLVDAGARTDMLPYLIRDLEQDRFLETKAATSFWFDGHKQELARINSKLAVMRNIMIYKESKKQKKDKEIVSYKNRKNTITQNVKQRDE